MIGSLSCLCDNCSMCVRACVCACVLACAFLHLSSQPSRCRVARGVHSKMLSLYCPAPFASGCRTKNRCDSNMQVAPLSETIRTADTKKTATAIYKCVVRFIIKKNSSRELM